MWRMPMLRLIAICAATAVVACSSRDIKPLPPPAPLPPGSFAFGVFGDGPYEPSEQGRFRRVLDDVSRADVQWLIHVGDIQWYPCSDEAYAARLADLNSVRHPVIYTPGDNEWTDCWQRRPGRYDPLDRLATIRRMFFAKPGHSLGRVSMELESQAADSMFREFVENTRWSRGGFLFATIHMVGSTNGLQQFPGRTTANDAEVERRTQAALSWLDGTFTKARQLSAKGVVLALHAEMNIESGREPREGYDRFLTALERNVAGFSGPVLLIHGDSHIERVDHPLKDARGRAYGNFTRLETFGSPDIGWVRVVVDSVAGRITTYEPRLMR